MMSHACIGGFLKLNGSFRRHLPAVAVTVFPHRVHVIFFRKTISPGRIKPCPRKINEFPVLGIVIPATEVASGLLATGNAYALRSDSIFRRE